MTHAPTRPGTRLAAMPRLPLLLVPLLLLALVACAPVAPSAPPASGSSGFASFPLRGDAFVFAARLKVVPNTLDSLIIYIEGDGRIVGPSGLVSANPTPRRPIGWELALYDPAPAVLYLPRLGQYSNAYPATSHSQYWTEKRFAPEIVQATSRALDAAKAHTQATRLHLVGFSGGGAIACLLAAQRDDVASLVTVAGLLDHATWTRTHGYKPLAGSLNPADFVHKLLHIPQIHFYGSQDERIQPEVSAQFLRLAPFANAQRLPVAVDHNNGWNQAWPTLLTQVIQPLRDHCDSELANPAD